MGQSFCKTNYYIDYYVFYCVYTITLYTIDIDISFYNIMHNIHCHQTIKKNVIYKIQQYKQLYLIIICRLFHRIAHIYIHSDHDVLHNKNHTIYIVSHYNI